MTLFVLYQLMNSLPRPKHVISHRDKCWVPAVLAGPVQGALDCCGWHWQTHTTFSDMESCSRHFILHHCGSEAPCGCWGVVMNPDPWPLWSHILMLQQRCVYWQNLCGTLGDCVTMLSSLKPHDCPGCSSLLLSALRLICQPFKGPYRCFSSSLSHWTVSFSHLMMQKNTGMVLSLADYDESDDQPITWMLNDCLYGASWSAAESSL